MSRAEQANAFCSALLGGPEGDDRLAGLYLTLWTSGDKRTRWRRADQPGAVASLVAELDEQPASQAVYICTTLNDQPRSCDAVHDGQHRHEGHCRYRPHKNESAGLIALWAEIDIAGPGHESEHLPPNLDAAMRLVESMQLPPTLIVHSGGGIHCWWVLTEPWLVRDAGDDPDAQGAERLRMAELERDWVAALRYRGERLGRWQVDAVHDLARLLRPAGTTNRKIADVPRKVEIIRHDPGNTYNPSDFEAALPDASVLTAYINPVSPAAANLTPEQQKELESVNIAAVWARVNSPDYAATDYLPEWLAELIELEAENGDDKIGKTWRGDRPEFKGDQSRYDSALMRLLADLDIDTEGLIEALMCRRLHAGATTEKVNPKRRLDYIVRTVTRFRAEAHRVASVHASTEDRIAQMAGTRLGGVPAEAPEPVVADPPPFDASDPAAADAAFTEFATGLAATEEPGDDEYAADREKVADEQVRAEANDGQRVEHPSTVRVEEVDPRPEIEAVQMAVLTELLVSDLYRQRGVEVWSIEYRDYGSEQRGRLMVRLPLDFDWPLDRPSRYRPGRLLPTEWWNRKVFKGASGFVDALEQDCLIVARRDAPATDWSECIRALVPLWRKDSSGADLATYAHDWLFDYLMLHHGTGEPNEVGAQGMPWVRETRGWRPNDPPVIYVDMHEFLDHCRRQPGAVIGRGGKGVIEFLHVVKRRPRVKGLGMGARQTWYEIEPSAFSVDEWEAIIEVTRHSYEVSAGRRGLRAAPLPDAAAGLGTVQDGPDPDAGVGIDGTTYG